MKGILFKPDMIKAIVEGRKSQTRRVIKGELSNYSHSEFTLVNYDGQVADFAHDKGMFGNIRVGLMYHAKPRYRIGEVVYIKEAWTSYIDEVNHGCLVFNENKAETGRFYPINFIPGLFQKQPKNGKHTPLFMPAWAARYFITIKDVRAERTKDITPEDCFAEGIVVVPTTFGIAYSWHDTGDSYHTPQDAYFALYDSINGKDAHKTNWDWIYSFKKVEVK